MTGYSGLTGHQVRFLTCEKSPKIYKVIDLFQFADGFGDKVKNDRKGIVLLIYCPDQISHKCNIFH